MEPVNIARCPDHGLHGRRDRCFVCDGPVEQVPMIPGDLALGMVEKARAQVDQTLNLLADELQRITETEAQTSEGRDRQVRGAGCDDKPERGSVIATPGIADGGDTTGPPSETSATEPARGGGEPPRWLVRAITDPGQVVRRRFRSEPEGTDESLTSWQARAVIAEAERMTRL